MEWTSYFLIIFTLVGGSSSISDRAFRDLNTEVKLLKTSFQRELDSLKFEVLDVRTELHLEKAKTARLEELLNGTGTIPEIDASLPTGVLYEIDVNGVEKLTEDVDKLKKDISELSQAKESLKQCEKDIRENKVSILRVEEFTKNVSDVMRNEILKKEHGMEASEKAVAALKTGIDTLKQVMTVVIRRAKKQDDVIVDIQRDIEGINDRANDSVEEMANIQSDLQLMSEETLSEVMRNEILKEEHGMEASEKAVATLKTGIDTFKQLMTVVIRRAKKQDDVIVDIQRDIEGIDERANESIEEMENIQRDLELTSEETKTNTKHMELAMDLLKEHDASLPMDVPYGNDVIDVEKLTEDVDKLKKEVSELSQAKESLKKCEKDIRENKVTILRVSDVMRNEILKKEHGMEASEKAVAALKTGIDTLKQVMTVVIGRAKKQDDDIVDIQRAIEGIHERANESVEEMANIQSDLQLMSEKTLSGVMRNEILKEEHGMEASEKAVAALKTGIDTLKQVMTVVIRRAKKQDDDIVDIQRDIEGINERANKSVEEMANIQSDLQLMSEESLSNLIRNEILKEEHGMEASEEAVAALKTGIDTLKQVMTVVIRRAKKQDDDIVGIQRDIEGINERANESDEEMENIQSDLQLMSEETKTNTKHMEHAMDLLNKHESTITQHTRALNWTRDQIRDVTTMAQHTKALNWTRDQKGDVTTMTQHTKALNWTRDQIGDVTTIAQHTKALLSTRDQIEDATTTEPEIEETDSQKECRRLIRAAVKSIAAAPKNYEGGISTVSSVSETQAGGKGMAELLYEGVTVKRGKDWKWDDQDGGGYGEVTRVRVGDLDTDWVSVTWENDHTNGYRMGVSSAYDLMIVEDKFDFSRC